MIKQKVQFEENTDRLKSLQDKQTQKTPKIIRIKPEKLCNYDN